MQAKKKRKKKAAPVATDSPRKLTVAVKAAILKAIEGGDTYRDAALCSGVGERTLRRWRSMGEKVTDGKLYELAAALAASEARARAKVAKGLHRGLTEIMTVTRTHSKKIFESDGKTIKEVHVERWTEEVLPDGRLQLEFLNRRDPEHWARREPEVRGSEKAWDETRKILGL